MLNDIKITKLSGGLRRRAPEGDMISGLLANGGIQSFMGPQFNVVYRLANLQDAILLGIDANYDLQNTVLVYEHIKEFFKVNPNGELYLMLLDPHIPYSEMLRPDIPTHAIRLLSSAGGKIRQLGVAYNPMYYDNVFFQPDYFHDTIMAIEVAQRLADYQYAIHQPVEILLEGKGFRFTPPNIRALHAPNVSVMIGQDARIARRQQLNYRHYAAVGTLLGAVSKARVNESVAWVERFNLEGPNLDSISIGNSNYFNFLPATLEELDSKGYIYFRTHPGISGIYLNDSHTCAEATSDYAYIENNRTIHKGVRNIRGALLPRLAMPVLIDRESGQLSPEVVKSLETDGRRSLETMLNNGEVSAIDVFVDPAQNILASSELKVAFSLVPTGTARRITVTIGFVNPF